MNYDEKEEITVIKKITGLKYSYIKLAVLVPLILLSTAFLFFFLLYWYAFWRRYLFYVEADINEATHLYIEGSLNQKEIVDLRRQRIAEKAKNGEIEKSDS